MKMKKRLISIAMAAVMAVGSIPAAGALLRQEDTEEQQISLDL